MPFQNIHLHAFTGHMLAASTVLFSWTYFGRKVAHNSENLNNIFTVDVYMFCDFHFCILCIVIVNLIPYYHLFVSV